MVVPPKVVAQTALFVFGELLSAIWAVKKKTDKFKHTLDSLHSVLATIAPMIEDIELLYQEELQTLLQNMKDCKTFVDKCSEIHRLNCLSMARHQARLERLEETFMKHYNTIMLAHILRHVLQNPRQTALHSTDTNLPAGVRSNSNNAFVLMLTARDLHIVWGNTPSYWIFTPVQGSRFAEVAELINVCWLDIRGWIKTSSLSPNTTYGAYFVFKMRDGAYGFENRAIEVMVRVMVVGQEDYEETKGTVNLVRSHDDSNAARVPLLAEPSSSATSRYPTERGNGWMEIELGEFFSPEGEDKTVEMALSEVDSNMWKSGMIVEGIEIRPKRTN